MDAMLQVLRAAEVNPHGEGDRVLVPGDPEFASERRNRELGVPVREEVLDELAVSAATVDVPFTLRG
jgi:LDH2 family malate/lactate/ureidoglycolate dehydrogenase